MALRKRKKKPPDLMSIPLESPSTRSSVVDLNRSLPIFWFRLQSVVWVQSRHTVWYRFHLLSSTIQAGDCVKKLWVCPSPIGFTKMSSTIRVIVTRSAIIENRWQAWKFDSVSMRRRSRCSSAASGMALFPFLLVVSTGSARKLCSSTLCSTLSGFSLYWKGSPCGIWLWPWLTESGLVGVEVVVDFRIWWSGLQFGTSLLCLFISWKQVHHGYGFVISQCRHLGSAGLLLRVLLIPSIILICLFWGQLVSAALTLSAWRLRIVLGFLALLCQDLLLSGYFARTLLSRHLYMLSLLRIHWQWSCLGFIRLIGVDIQVVLEVWDCSLQFRLSKLWSSLVWQSICLEVSFVFTPDSPLGGAWLILQISSFAGCLSICLPGWTRQLCFRLWLCYSSLNTFVLVGWFIRMQLDPLLIFLLLMCLFLWWMGSPLCTVPLGLSGGCWGALDYVGNDHSGTIKVLFSPLIHLGPPFPFVFDLVFVRWCGIVCLLSSLLITVFLYLVLSVLHPLSIVWMWWQGSCFPVTTSPPLIGRLPPSLCVDQHVYMLRMYLCMLGKPPVGGWTQMYLLKLFSNTPVVWFVTFLSCAFPSSSLSLPLVSKYAQRRVSLHAGLCWHLVFLQTVWDEVKGKCPLVYEDLLSETRNSAYLSFSWFSWFFCYLSRCLIAGLQLNHDKDELKIVLGYEACQHVFWHVCPIAWADSCSVAITY